MRARPGHRAGRSVRLRHLLFILVDVGDRLVDVIWLYTCCELVRVLLPNELPGNGTAMDGVNLSRGWRGSESNPNFEWKVIFIE